MVNLTMSQLKESFPFETPRARQMEELEELTKQPNGHLFQMPPGEGKTGILLAPLIANAKQKIGPQFLITPTKTQVEQIEKKHPEFVLAMYGRSEYPCTYYHNLGHPVSAEQSPCYFIKCPHRVDQDTGKTFEENTEPCEYFAKKYLAKNADSGKIVVCTTSFFLVNRILVPSWQELQPKLVCVDEVHNIAKVARRTFEYTLTDYHLYKIVDMLQPFDNKHAEILKKFADKFKNICWKRQSYNPTLLADNDLISLIQIIDKINRPELEKNIKYAIKNGLIDPERQRHELNTLEKLVFRIRRLIRSLQYALTKKDRYPLNYVVAFYYKKDDEEITESQKKARFFLTIYSYFVIPVIKKALGENIIACSATIGDPKILAFETAINLPFKSYNSSFDIRNTKIYMPNDTPNLAKNKRKRNDLNKTLRMIVNYSQKFASNRIRSLVVVISDFERKKFLEFAKEAGLNAISYGNDQHPKETAEAFKNGEGDVLVGTAANYSEGVDLPQKTAPVIFFLRPGYPRPDSPESQFEDRRFSNGQAWALRNWRVMIEALQVRGRNIRSADDMGVCFFISQGFRRFLYPSLPEWLKPAYKNEITMEDAVKESIKILS